MSKSNIVKIIDTAIQEHTQAENKIKEAREKHQGEFLYKEIEKIHSDYMTLYQGYYQEAQKELDTLKSLDEDFMKMNIDSATDMKKYFDMLQYTVKLHPHELDYIASVGGSSPILCRALNEYAEKQGYKKTYQIPTSSGGYEEMQGIVSKFLNETNEYKQLKINTDNGLKWAIASNHIRKNEPVSE